MTNIKLKLCTFLNALFYSSLLTAQIDTIVVQANYDQQTLDQILTQIGNNYPVDFYYKKEWLPQTIYKDQYGKNTLPNILDSLLINTSLTYSIFEDFAIIIAPKADFEKQYSADYFSAKYQQPTTTNTSERVVSIISIGNPSQLSTTGKALVTGKILDNKKTPLIGVLVYVESLNKNTVTDINGTFELELPIGQHLLEAQSVGYEISENQVEVFSNGSLTINLEEEVYELNEIVVASTISDANVSSTQIGVARLSTKEIRQLPSFLGEADVIKSLFTLPGVSTAGEGASGFNVRGGNIDQNLITQDGALVFNSSHVLGFFSIFNTDAIKNITLYKGHIPAQFGGRISSVLDVQIKDANNKEFKLSGGLGIVSSRAVAEIPLVKGKTSLLIGGRSSYSDWTLKQAKDFNVRNSSAFFYDLNAKLTHILSANGSNVSAGYYRSYDFFRYAQQFGYSWGTELTTFRWNQIINNQLSFSLQAAYGGLDNSFFEPSGFNAFTLENGLNHTKVRPSLFFTTADGHEIRVGGEWVRYIGNPETLLPRGRESGVAPDRVEKDRGQQLVAYINDDWEINNRLAVSVGLRYSVYQQLGPEEFFFYEDEQNRSETSTTGSVLFDQGDVITTYSNLEPRLSLKIGLNNENSIKLSYNRLAQYVHLISNTTASTPIDIWQVSTEYVPPQLAANYSIGYFQNFEQNRWETSFEIFYKDIQQSIAYRDLPTLLLNEQLEIDLLTGIGRAFGTELSIKKNTGRWTGQLAYTFSRSQQQVIGPSLNTTINNGDWFPANFDSPHNVNLTFKYQVNRRHLFSANFVYRTGRPVTAPIAAYELGSLIVPHFSPRNLFRIPHYHRLDLAYTVKRNAIRSKRFKGSLTFSIYNIYFRKNAFSIFFRRSTDTAANAFQLAVLGTAFPSISYNFEF